MEPFADFLTWTWERHHNPLSWYIRPLFLLPFCYFAYKRSVPGILLTLIALATSMFWFPPPKTIDPQVAAFLEKERLYLTGEWTGIKVMMAALVPLTFLLLGGAFWNRSWIMGATLINFMALSKVAWSFYYGQQAAWSLVPPALLGLLICNLFLYSTYHLIRGQERKAFLSPHKEPVEQQG